MTQSQSHQQVLVLARICWILLVLAGFIFYLWHNGQQIVATLLEIRAVTLFGALSCLLCGKFAAVNLMRASLQLHGGRLISWRDNIWIYASSDVAKYIPGGIWAITGRIVHYRNFGMTAAGISKALLLENMGLAITAVLLGASVGLMLLAERCGSLVLLFVPFLVLASFGLIIVARKARRLEFIRPRAKTVRMVLRALGVMLLGWMAMGTSFFLLLREYNTLHYWLWSIGSYALAFIAGMVVVFAPAGVGVREGVLSMAGQFIGVPTTTILDAAIINRVFWVVGDLCVFSFALIVRVLGK